MADRFGNPERGTGNPLNRVKRASGNGGITTVVVCQFMKTFGLGVEFGLWIGPLVK
jgi:hypothetical protein